MSHMNGVDGNWHNASGGGIPFRPPTVHEALPYSPFTSIIPFSPDVIPYPSTAPPTPPTTLTPEQQTAGKRALEALGKGLENPGASRHVHDTMAQLQHLLNPDELSEFNFKSLKHFASPSPDTSTSHFTNGSVPTQTATLSPFASRLLHTTNIAYQQGTSRPSTHPQSVRAQQRQNTVHVSAQTPSSAGFKTPQNVAHALNPVHQKPTPSPSPAFKSTSGHVGPSVVVNQLPSEKKKEHQRYDNIENGNSATSKQVLQSHDTIAAMRPQEREVAERRLQKLGIEIDRISAEKDDPDESTLFATWTTDEGDVTVLGSKAIATLSEAISGIVELGCFTSVPQEQVLQIQSLCEPLITATSHSSLYLATSDAEETLSHIQRAIAGLRASKLVLQTMTESYDSRRTCSEDLVQIIVRVLKKVLESCILPIVDARPSSDPEIFEFTRERRKEVLKVLQLSGSNLSLLALLVGKVKLTAMALSPLESVAISIVFAQNSEKDSDSALGAMQKFENFRQKSMDVLAQIFAFHSDQRESINNEVLSNLEKLPDKRASARQFKSARDAPIMLVSALFMRFVQAAASRTSRQLDGEHSDHDLVSEDESSDDEEADSGAEKSRKPKGPQKRFDATIRDLWHSAITTASYIASYLVNRASSVSKSGDKPFRILLDYFIQDFCNVLGSPEWPAASILLERILVLMIQIADNVKDNGVNAVDMALAVMGSMGSGILDFKHRLKHVKRGLDVSQSDTSSRLVPLADDALKAGINKHDVVSLKGPFAEVLRSLPNFLNGQGSHPGKSDPYLLSLSGFYVTSWANTFYQAFPRDQDDQPQDHTLNEIERQLKKIATDSKVLLADSTFHASENETKLAAGIISLQERFCIYLPALINRFIQNTKSESAKIKSRAVTSLSALIDKDPQTLDENTFGRFAGLLADSSPQVRANTLNLLSKCLEQDPSLERFCLQRILAVMTDSSNEPKKKAIKILRDIYVGLTRQDKTVKDKKLTIATGLLLPILDEEKAVAELSRQTLEEIWFNSSAVSSRSDQSQLKLERETRATLIVDTVQVIQGRQCTPDHIRAFETFFSRSLSTDAKNASSNFQTCKALVADILEGVIGIDQATGEMTQSRMLQAMAFFAKIKPALFTAEQVQLLKLYVKNLNSFEDLALFQPTIVIFRYVFPSLPSLQEVFLKEVHLNLQKVVSRIGPNTAAAMLTAKAAEATATSEAAKAHEASEVARLGKRETSAPLDGTVADEAQEVATAAQAKAAAAAMKATDASETLARWMNTLIDVAHCLWMISPLVKAEPGKSKSGLDKLFTQMASTAAFLEPYSSIPMEEKNMKTILWLMIVLGVFGKVCDFDKHVDAFRPIIAAQARNAIAQKKVNPKHIEKLSKWKGSSIAVLLLDIILPFARQPWESVYRAQALRSLGEICQRYPKHFTRADVDKTFRLPFINEDLELMRVVLTQIRDFLALAERRSETGAEIAVGEGAIHGAERLESSFAATDNDAATMHLAQSFLNNIVRCALEQSDDMAHSATDIIVSISRQGLVHPKECGPPLVALSTSPDPVISKKAAVEHTKIHLHHETMFEKEYVSAVRMAFKYQGQVFSDHRGVVDKTMKPKMQLLFEALKQGSRKVLKKFVSNLFREMDFDLSKLDIKGPLPESIQFAQFCLENFAVFDYSRTDDVHHVLSTIESIVLKQTGPAVALSIETDFPQPGIEPKLDQAGIDHPEVPLVTSGTEDALPKLENPYDSISDDRLRQLTVASIILHMMWETRTQIRRQYNIQGKLTVKDLQKPASRNNLVTPKEYLERIPAITKSLDSRDAMVRECKILADIINVDKEHAIKEDDVDPNEELSMAGQGYETPDEDDKGGQTPNSGRNRKRKGSAQIERTPKKARGRPNGSKGKKRSSRTPEPDDWD
ncbi:hypothetical protein BU24DRAFT_406595 [Aaosphaeria arxii CBS 175.79]|uniref:Sister chromatid cohesion protein n=1 Tax=Aaosphaeria arxii CBS 175.79 TaxID=1450172 RepID=A0A6A5Y607_9PLEO|nr:uncharacterized protein BU24DRAFT_406595 [Aaosphaeria arxii CBS 175.79]KAF2019994.1 hypothetical protein BU24DRAFT_406595 [Aaosphaeria arxii CBS 175.79]